MAHNTLINAMNSFRNVSNSFSQTTVDFNNFKVIAVFDTIRPTGGNTIDITGVTENSTRILITIQRLQSGDAAIVMQPFHIVKIPKSSKPVVFQ